MAKTGKVVVHHSGPIKVGDTVHCTLTLNEPAPAGMKVALDCIPRYVATPKYWVVEPDAGAISVDFDVVALKKGHARVSAQSADWDIKYGQLEVKMGGDVKHTDAIGSVQVGSPVAAGCPTSAYVTFDSNQPVGAAVIPDSSDKTQAWPDPNAQVYILPNNPKQTNTFTVYTSPALSNVNITASIPATGTPIQSGALCVAASIA